MYTEGRHYLYRADLSRFNTSTWEEIQSTCPPKRLEVNINLDMQLNKLT